jgi:hypothetical protein
MTLHDDDQSSGGPETGRRRRRIAVGAAGLAVVLGGGAYAIASSSGDRHDSTVARDPAALGPLAGEATQSETPSAPASAAQPSSGQPSPVPPVASAARGAGRAKADGSPSTPGADVSEEIKAARAKAAKDGFPLRRAKTTGPHIESGPVSERTEQRQDGVLRVVTARFDLTGQRELLWPAHGGKPVGDAECTQTFRFANEGAASTKPNLLLCWRTSPTRSVVTVLVDRSGKPSTAESVKVIDSEWAKLG